MIGILSAIGGLAQTWLTGRNEIKKAKQEMVVEEYKNKARLMRDEQNYNHEWEMAGLVDKDKWLRRCSFIMFASPFFIAIFAPQHIEEYFKHAIAVVPKWWQEAFVIINGTVWGASSMKNILPSIIDTFKSKKK